MSGRGGAGERSMVAPATPTSYYGRPIIKEPVWKWPIPAYFFTGGLAAGSALLAAGGRVLGDQRLTTQSELVGTAAILASTGFLIDDLGRPERFANMLRVARPSSPMSVGSWILAGFGPAIGTAAAAGVLGVFPRLRAIAGWSSAILAPAVATYTAVLLADTAVPAWHESRRELPFVFAGGAAASAGGLSLLLHPGDRTGAARRLALLGAAAELANTRIMETRLGDLAQPYREGRAGRLRRISTAATVAGAAMTAAGRRRRRLAMAGGALVMTGAAVERFAIFEAGRQSARDPRYTVEPQRQRVDERH